MNRSRPAKQPLQVTLYVMCVSLLMLSAVCLGVPSETRPNIIVIMVDDMGFSDLGCYGGEVDTPNLDRLAASGLRFSQFYNGAKCSQSRSMLLTGRYFTEAGMNLSGSVTIAEALGEVPLAGFFANGEISNSRLYGYTGVIALFL